MNMTVSVTDFVAGSSIPTVVTLTDDVSWAYFGSENSKIKVSLDNVVFSADVRLYDSQTTVYVKCNSSIVNGEYELLGTLYGDGDYVTKSQTINVTGGVVPQTPQYENFSFGFAPRTATIQYNGTLDNYHVSVGARLTGNVLDHIYQFEVERVAEQGSMSVISGASYAEWLVNSLIQYEVKFEFHLSSLSWERPSFRTHLSAIENVIGKEIIYLGADFYPKTDVNYAYRSNPFSLSYWEVISGSFGSILNNLIGWSTDVPSMTINMYVHNDKIYLIQRGYEQNNFTPLSWSTLPTITHQIRHTEWANSQTQSYTPKQIASSDAMNSNKPFDGVISWGSTTLTYVDGYLTTEVRNGVTTNYYYTDETEGKYLSRKETLETDEDTGDSKFSISTYTYQTTAKEKYLFEETNAVYDGQDASGYLEKSTLIRHIPIGGGWYGTTVYDTTDGEEKISDSLSQGAPGQKANQYLVDSGNDALRDDSEPRQITVPLTGVARARQTYPIADLSTLQAIASCLDNYEGAEEIILTGEISGGNHIYTYNDVINYNGNAYKLVSNSVNRTHDSVRQSITAVRYVL